MRAPVILSCAAAAALSVSCALFAPDVAVTAILPSPPGHWSRAFAEFEFELVYWDSTGAQHTQAVPVAATLGIRCSRRGNSPVLAYPRAPADVCGLLRPAGGLFALDLEDGNILRLSWEKGPLALLMSLLLPVGGDTSLVNAGRLAEYVAREPDPWELDLVGMAQKIAGGSFTAYDIDLLPRREVTVMAGPGEWFFESPFSDVMVADALGAVTAPRLTLGMHGLFSVEGKALQVYVGQRETVVTAAGSPSPSVAMGSLSARPWARSPSPSVATGP